MYIIKIQNTLQNTHYTRVVSGVADYTICTQAGVWQDVNCSGTCSVVRVFFYYLLYEYSVCML